MIGFVIALALSQLVFAVLERSDWLGSSDFSLTWRVLTVGIAFSLLFGVLSGLIPAWRTARMNPRGRTKRSSIIMWRQQLLLLWNRRHSNWLIIAEVAIAAMLTFAIVSYALHYATQMRAPLGYQYENVFEVTTVEGFPTDPAHNHRVGQLIEALRARPDVAAASAGGMYLFRGWQSQSEWDDDEGKEYMTMRNNFELGADAVLDVDIVEGRWFNESDFGQEDTPVVVNRAFVDRNLSVGNAVGSRFTFPGSDDSGQMGQIVGIVSAFKQYSALIPDEPYMISLSTTEKPAEGSDYRSDLLYIVVRAADSAPATFAADITSMLNRMAPDMPIRVESLAAVRGDDIRRKLRPLRIGALIGGFFLLLVCFGLFGIFWQSVTTRTSELGLKRALGLSSGQVIRHFILEHGMLSVVALVLATLILAHIPLTGWLEFLDWKMFVMSLAVVWVALLGLTALCAAYPAWQASRITPSEALHYE